MSSLSVPTPCKREGCSKMTPPYSGRGRYLIYCSRECQRAAKYGRREGKFFSPPSPLGSYPISSEHEAMVQRHSVLAGVMKSQVPSRHLRRMADDLPRYPSRGLIAQVILTDRHGASREGSPLPVTPLYRFNGRPRLWSSVAMQDMPSE